MRRHFGWALASVISFGLTGPGGALAADMAVKARPVPVAVYSWTGCYVGGTVGTAWGRSDFDWSNITESGTAFAAGAATALPAAANARLHSTGFAGGGEVGCNYQTGAFVFGGEADIQWTDIGVSRTTTSVGDTTGGPGIVPGAITESMSSHWLATFRGRAGFAQDSWLVYATGGLAVANVSYFDQVCFGALALVPSCNTAASSGTRTGWVVGGGIEWAVFQNWSIKAEYLHADLGHTTNTSILVPTAGGVNPFPNATINHNHNLTEDVVRIGANYKFGWGGPVVAKY
jgi:outer membrane immunogenic protein